LFKESSVLSFGKLRGSYGITGSDNVPDYAFLDTYTTTQNNYDGISGLNPTRLYNPEFGWEENKKIEAGLELGFLKDRIFLSTAWYRNRSSNQLIGIPLPTTTGFSSITANFEAIVENTGFEIDLRTTNIQNDNFTWRTTFNISSNKNKLIRFDGLEGSTFANTLVIGQPLNIRKVYRLIGVNSDTGVYEFQDFNEDGSIDTPNDNKVIKDLNPKFFGGLGNTLSYKNLQLEVFFQFKKQEGRNFIPSSSKPGSTKVNQRASVFNRWRQAGDIAPVQIYSQSASANRPAQNAFRWYQNSDATVTDASFIRLRNVSLTYSLPKKWVKGIDASIYLQGQNLLTITDYDGFDPDQLNQENLPPLRQLTLGLNLSF
ncbi:MAG: SusC/RagA family TonB-linked outer membrane protein, partial [Allomuricauda sp.]